MTDEGRTIYQTCREAAGLTQERAAELLCVSPRQLARYEAGETIPADDVACRMVDLYGSTYLAVGHLRNASRMAASIIPAVDHVSLERAAIRLNNTLARLIREDGAGQLLEIAEDGAVDEAERPVFGQLVEILSDLARNYLELQVAAGEKWPRE